MDYFLDFPSVMSDGLANISSLIKELNIVIDIETARSLEKRKTATCPVGPEDVSIILDQEIKFTDSHPS